MQLLLSVEIWHVSVGYLLSVLKCQRVWCVTNTLRCVLC